MPARSSVPAKERTKRSRIAQLITKGEIMRANLVTMARTCGHPNCKCARGEKHVSLYVYQSQKGKPRMTYVPKEWEQRIREWVERHQEIKKLLEELSQMSWERLKHRKE